MTVNSLIWHEFDQARLKKTLDRVAKLGKKKNKVLKPAVKAGMTRLSREIRKGIPAYQPNRRSQSDHRTDSGRRRSRLWEAKAAVGSTAKVAVKGPHKGGIEGKAGASVGKPKTTSAQRKKKRAGFKGRGIGLGNLHWYLAGTKKRYTRTGIYTGRMRKPRLVQRVKAQYGPLATMIIDQKITTGLKKEWLKSKK